MISDYELAACVVVNIENMAAAVPGLAENPMYKVVLYQAKELEAQLSGENK